VIAFALAAAVAICAPRAGAADLLPLIPRDTLAALSIPNLSTLAADWEKCPLGGLDKEPRLADSLEPMRRGIRRVATEFETHWGITVRDLHESFPAGVVAFLTLFEWVSDEVYEYDLCFLAELGRRPEQVRGLVEKMLEKTPPDARRSRYTFRDETIYSIKFNRELPAAPPRVDPKTGRTIRATPGPGSALALVEDVPVTIQYAFVGNYLAVCEGRREPIRGIITALKEPSLRLGEDAEFRRVSEAAGRPGQVAAWVQGGRLWQIQAQHLRQTDPKKDYLGLGLQQLGGLRANLELSPRALGLEAALGLPENPKGVLGFFLKPERENELKTAALSPPDVLAYSSQLVDGRALWDGTRDILLRFAPQFWALLNLQLRQINQQFGVDIERGLIGAIGGELALYERAIPPRRGVADRMARRSSTTLLLGLREGRVFRQNAERLLGVLGSDPYNLPLEKSTYLDYELWTIKQRPEWQFITVPAWTLTDGYLIVTTDAEELPSVLRAWSGTSEKSLAADPAFRSALASMPSAGRAGFSYAVPRNLSDLLHPLLTTFSESIAASMGESASFATPPLDTSAREVLARRLGPLYSATFIQPRTLTLQARLNAAP
jgi:hypothetical protein